MGRISGKTCAVVTFSRMLCGVGGVRLFRKSSCNLNRWARKRLGSSFSVR